MVAHNGRYTRRGFAALGAGATLGLVAASRGALAQDATPVASPDAAEMGVFDNTGLTEIVVTAEQYTFSASTPGALAEGWYIITLVNNTDAATNLNLALLPEGTTGSDLSGAAAQVFSAEGGELPEWWAEASFAGGPLAPAGESNSTLAYLTPGNWYLFKSLPEAQQGPSSIAVLTPEELEANYGVAPEAAATPAASPEVAGPVAPEGVVATVTVDVADDGIMADGAPAGGQQVLQVNNAGEQVHNLIMLHTADTVDAAGAADLASAWLAGEATSAMAVAGVGTLSAGSTAFVGVDVQPGNYVIFGQMPGDLDNGVVTMFTAQ